MNTIEIESHVNRLFRANRKEVWAEIPIIGGHYLPGEDNVGGLKKKARNALAAREWFYEKGPAYAQPLPLSYNEREDLKTGGTGVQRILAWYARSLEGRKYDYLEHPSFFDYACGVIASESTLHFIRNDRDLQRLFPPRHLDGLNSGLCWVPPKRSIKKTGPALRKAA